MANDDSEQSYPQITFNASGETIRHARKRAGTGGRSVHQAAKRDLLRYYRLLERERPIFDYGETLLLLNALNNISLNAAVPVSGAFLAAEVRALPESCAARHQIELDSFADRLEELSRVKSLAVVDAAERYWATPEVKPREVGFCGVDAGGQETPSR